MFDDQKNAYVPTLVGLGMLVQVHDPDDKELLSRVMYMLPKIIFVYRIFLITNLMLLNFIFGHQENTRSRIGMRISRYTLISLPGVMACMLKC